MNRVYPSTATRTRSPKVAKRPDLLRCGLHTSP